MSKGEVNRGKSNEDVNQAFKPTNVADDFIHEVKIECADESPVKASYYEKNKGDYVNCFQLLSPPLMISSYVIVPIVYNYFEKTMISCAQLLGYGCGNCLWYRCVECVGEDCFGSWVGDTCS